MEIVSRSQKKKEIKNKWDMQATASRMVDF